MLFATLGFMHEKVKIKNNENNSTICLGVKISIILTDVLISKSGRCKI